MHRRQQDVVGLALFVDSQINQPSANQWTGLQIKRLLEFNLLLLRDVLTLLFCIELAKIDMNKIKRTVLMDHLFGFAKFVLHKVVRSTS